MKDDLLTAKPDYEAMYNQLLCDHKRLCAEHAELEQEYRSLSSAFESVRAQLDIVHLIFGT